MAIATTSLIYEAYQTLFTSLPHDKAIPKPERSVRSLNGRKYYSVVWIDIEGKIHIQMHIPLDQRMHEQICQPNSNSDQTMIPKKNWQLFPMSTRIEWGLFANITDCIHCLHCFVPSNPRSFCGAAKLAHTNLTESNPIFQSTIPKTIHFFPPHSYALFTDIIINYLYTMAPFCDFRTPTRN